jgi:hypothetical protein
MLARVLLLLDHHLFHRDIDHGGFQILSQLGEGAHFLANLLAGIGPSRSRMRRGKVDACLNEAHQQGSGKSTEG